MAGQAQALRAAVTGRHTARAWVCLIAAAAVLSGCHGDRPGLRKQTRLIMDTYVTVGAWAQPAKADRALAAAFARLEEVSRKFNHLDTTSPLYAFNNRNEPLTDPEIIRVLAAAESVSVLSGGVFDVTVEPLVRLWGFYDDSQAVPSQRAIDSCRRSVGHRNLVFGPGRVTKRNPQTTIDLGGIAKGHALVEATRALRQAGVDSAIIDLGGDVYAVGRRGGRNWRVGIRNPRGDGIVGVIGASDMAVVTSGDYERFFFGPDSVRYCHIIDPRTGWPARGVVSTTVMMRDPVQAQGLSKVLFILGPSSLELGQQTEHFEALLITDSLKAVMSEGLVGALDIDLLAGADSTRPD